jgi:hypothetical protein
VKVRAKTERPAERDWLHRLHESRARKLGVLGVLTPAEDRTLAREAGLTVAELRRCIAQAKAAT